MTESLKAYYDEIRAHEDRWYPQLVENGWILGTSTWHGRLNQLREIDERHGIQPDDPRVYSIAAYQVQEAEIEAEWKALGKAKSWDIHDWKKGYPEGFVSAERHFGVRWSDCYARHFPRLDSLRPETIDTAPKLWAHITNHVIKVKDCLDLSPLTRRPAEKRAYDKELETVYSLLHRLKIPWAKQPPYPDLRPREALDELRQIANRLERDEQTQIRLTAKPQTLLDVIKQLKTGQKTVSIAAVNLEAWNRLTTYCNKNHGTGPTLEAVLRLRGALGERLKKNPQDLNRMPLATFIDQALPVEGEQRLEGVRSSPPLGPAEGALAASDALMTALDRLTTYVAEHAGNRPHGDFLELLTLDGEVSFLCQATGLALPRITYVGVNYDLEGFCGIPVIRHMEGCLIFFDPGWHLAMQNLRRAAEMKRNADRRAAEGTSNRPAGSTPPQKPTSCKATLEDKSSLDDVGAVLSRRREEKARREEEQRQQRDEEDRRSLPFRLHKQLTSFRAEDPYSDEACARYTGLLVELCAAARAAGLMDDAPQATSEHDGSRLAAKVLRFAFAGDADGVTSILKAVARDPTGLDNELIGALLDLIRCKVLRLAADAHIAEAPAVACDQRGAEHGDGARGRRKPDSPIPNDEANLAARAYIEEREQARENITARSARDHIMKTLGGSFALGRVPQLPAWIAYQARRQSTSEPRRSKEPRQLTPEMLAAIGQDDDPSARMATAEEVAWRYLVENAKSPAERERLNTMTPAEKAEAIQLVIEQSADQDQRGNRSQE